MDHMALRERDPAVDLESGGTTSEEEGNKEPVSSVKQAKKLLGRVRSGFVSFDGSIKGEDGVRSCNALISDDAENPEFSLDKKSGEETLGLVEKKTVKEKRKKTSSKKPPKPPRPPRGPSLDVADMKLVREISELAMLKHSRIERMKALKKMKAAKTTSSNSNLCAMVITFLFCLVIIFQGMCTRSSSSVSFQGSPESAVGLISVQYYKNLSACDTNGTVSGSPNYVEQVSGSGPQEEVSTVAG